MVCISGSVSSLEMAKASRKPNTPHHGFFGRPRDCSGRSLNLAKWDQIDWYAVLMEHPMTGTGWHKHFGVTQRGT